MTKIFLAIFATILISQDIRYIDEIFDSIDITEDVVYGNSPDLPFLFLFEWNTNDIDLEMDIYEPANDSLDSRPVIIFAHSGAFFSGSKEADDMVDLAIASAKRGYVAVSMNYRLHLNILSSYSGERAVYRGVQDASAVIRYLREFHEELRIDPENIFIWGSSAGSFIGLHLAFCDESERPEATYGGGNDPDLGCIDCEGNDYNHRSKPDALISCWGGIGDLEWIDAEDNVPTALFHGTSDLIVPFDSGYPFTVDIALPIVYGSNPIHSKLEQVDIDNEFYPGEGEPHEYWGALNGNWIGGPNENFEQIKANAFNFLYNYIDIYDLGDINQDLDINILDVVITVNMIIGLENINNLADINVDGAVDILDIVQLINMILED